MKRNLLVLIAVISATFVAPANTVLASGIKMNNELEDAFVAEPCTVIITGNLHTRRSDCTSGLGRCFWIKIKLPQLKLPLPLDIEPIEIEGKGGSDRGNAILSLNPENPEQVVIDFIHLDEEQMKEDSWDLEEDYIIDNPELSEEFEGVKSITLLKDNYKIDRSVNKVGRSFVRCKID